MTKSFTIKLLIVDGDSALPELWPIKLPQSYFGHYSIDSARSLRDALDLMERKQVDVVLLDLNLPDSQGVDTLKKMLRAHPETAIVVMTGPYGDGLGVEVVAMGAQDFLVKGQYDIHQLSKSIYYALHRKQVEMELKAAKEKLAAQTWGLQKTNDQVKILHKELEDRNKTIQELDALKFDFVAGISHELRTPLTIIREGVSQLLDGLLGPTTAEQKQFLSITLNAVDRLARIIDDLLDMSKLEAGKVELDRQVVDVAAVLKEIAQAFHSKIQMKGLDLALEGGNNGIKIYADRDRLIQVFSHLVGNALKFTDKGRITMTVVDRENEVECSVTDTGRGIAHRDLERVFGTFERIGRSAGSEGKGTGLSLAICKKIVKLHGGEMWVESRLGAGSKFVFRLPKVVAEELLRQHVKAGLEKAIRDEIPLTVIVLRLRNVDAVKKLLGEKVANQLLIDLAELSKKSLHRKEDRVVVGQESILIFLPSTRKDDALIVSGRIGQVVEEHIEKQGLGQLAHISSQVATFPDVGGTVDDILKKAFG